MNKENRNRLSASPIRSKQTSELPPSSKPKRNDLMVMRTPTSLPEKSSDPALAMMYDMGYWDGVRGIRWRQG
jgi:hypothetical protein